MKKTIASFVLFVLAFSFFSLYKITVLWKETREEKMAAVLEVASCQEYNSLLCAMTAKKFPKGKFVDYLGNPIQWSETNFQVVFILSRSKNCSACLVSELELLTQIRESLPGEIALFCFNYAFDELDIKRKLRILGVTTPVLSGQACRDVADLLNEHLPRFDRIFLLLDANNHILKAAACSVEQTEKVTPTLKDFLESVQQW